jgi:hypothetical protein
MRIAKVLVTGGEHEGRSFAIQQELLENFGFSDW